MKQDTVIICDTNAEEIIDHILQNIYEGAEPKSDLEKMAYELSMLDMVIELKEYVICRNKIIEYIQSFYV